MKLAVEQGKLAREKEENEQLMKVDQLKDQFRSNISKKDTLLSPQRRRYSCKEV